MDIFFENILQHDGIIDAQLSFIPNFASRESNLSETSIFLKKNKQ